jgi:hypothetical protein
MAWLIWSEDDYGHPYYWNETQGGWVPRIFATRFSNEEKEAKHLPEDADGWVKA